MEFPGTIPNQKTGRSSSLEEIIQTGQASRENLSAVLVPEFYAPLYRLALGIMDDPDAAVFTAVEALIAVLQDAPHYDGRTSVQNWVFGKALEQCKSEYRRLKRARWWKSAIPFTRKAADFGASTPTTYMDAELWLALDHADEATKIVAILYYLMDWKPTEIAALLNQAEIDIVRRLKSLRKQFEEVLAPFALPPEELETEPFDARLATSFQHRWPAIQPGETDLEDIRSIVLQQVEHRSRGSPAAPK